MLQRLLNVLLSSFLSFRSKYQYNSLDELGVILAQLSDLFVVVLKKNMTDAYTWVHDKNLDKLPGLPQLAINVESARMTG